MSTSFKVIGLEKVCANLIIIGGKIDAIATKAITDEANTVLFKSMAQAPVETGDMRRSGTVEDPKITARAVTVEIGFHTSYAEAVHENLKARHEIGKAKFLEDPVNESAPTFYKNVAARIRGGI